MMVQVSNHFLCLLFQALHTKNLMMTKSCSSSSNSWVLRTQDTSPQPPQAGPSHCSSRSTGTCFDMIDLSACGWHGVLEAVILFLAWWPLSSALRWARFCCWAIAQASSCLQRASSSLHHASYQRQLLSCRSQRWYALMWASCWIGHVMMTLVVGVVM